MQPSLRKVGYDLRTPRHYVTRRRAVTLMLLGLIAALFGPLGRGAAVPSASAAPLASVPAVAVNVPAGGSASLEVRGFALQPGAVLPQGPMTLGQQPLASDRVRTTLYYGIDWGYAATDPQQVALAIWWAQDGNWLAPDHAIAERIAGAAS